MGRGWAECSRNRPAAGHRRPIPRTVAMGRDERSRELPQHTPPCLRASVVDPQSPVLGWRCAASELVDHLEDDSQRLFGVLRPAAKLARLAS